MIKKLFPGAALAAFLLAAAPGDPIVWRVENPPAKAVKAGSRISLKLAAKIQDGWHLYSMKPLDEGPIPTRIWLAEGQPFQLAGAIQASPPQSMHDPSFNMEVEFYEGEAVFDLPVRVVAAEGPQKVVISTSFQACDYKICLPPKTVKVEVPVSVSK
jgi:DsbC/DsbD-like thiol-disulfide interchange protein